MYESNQEIGVGLPARMFRYAKGFYLFISAERGLMVFMIAMGAALLIGGRSSWSEASYLGLIGFFLWSCTDAVNNMCDVELDKESDRSRSEFTASLGFAGFIVVAILFSIVVGLGILANRLYATAFILLGVICGVAYSVPPVRLRQTIFKPLVNSTVGAIPVLITAAFYNSFTIEAFTLAIFMGAATAINSLWEDLADYSSDLKGNANTFLVVLGFRRGLHVTILLGYSLIPLMVLTGLMFKLGTVYYVIFSVLIGFMSLHILQERKVILGEEKEKMHQVSSKLARDFVIIAVIHTTNFMLASFLKGI